MKSTKRRYALAAVGGAVLILIIAGLMPKPLPVDVGSTVRGGMQVTVDQEGETRARDRYVVAAPVAGRLARIELRDGDPVERNQIVAVLNPAPIDPREEAEARARVEAAEARKREADELAVRAESSCEQAKRDYERAEQLEKQGYIAVQSLEQAKSAETASVRDLEAARFRAQAARSEVTAARAALLTLEPKQGAASRTVRLRSPVRGRVLRVAETSERVVPAGAPLLVVGDPARIEVVVDVLSTDAVGIRKGMPVLLENWGGEKPLKARVRLVEPAAFKKISALGIEEQRVNVIADFVDPPGQLGDGYRVEARIVVWSNENVVKAPVSALFRHNRGWALFRVEKGKARLTEIVAGRRNAVEVEVLKGIGEGAQVILHPTNDIVDKARVKARR